MNSSRSRLSRPMNLRDAIDQFFEQSFMYPRTSWYAEQAQRLPVDAWLTEEALVIKANLPGINPDDVQVTLEGDSLTISAEIPKPEEPGQTLMLERPYGKVSRTLTLNVPVEVDKIDAVFKDGVLTLTLPKAERIRPRTIKVRTN